MTITAATTTTDDREYKYFLQRLQDRFATVSGPLFTTDVLGLFLQQLL